MLENVSFAHDGIAVFDDLSLAVTEQRVGIVGANGCGKSTLLRLMAGLLVPETGSVQMDNINIAKDRAAALDAVGVIFQNPDRQIIFPTIDEELSFGLTQQGASKEDAARRVEQLLVEEGLSHWLGRSTQALSHGQRHRLCLLSVLAMRPRTILLDEPYAGLDIPTSMRLHRRLRAVDARVVLVTHDPASLQGFDRVIWLAPRAKGIRMDGHSSEVLPLFEQEMRAMGQEEDD